MSRFLSPAIAVMDKLPFKIKIIASISILFILLIMPSRTTFTTYINDNDKYNKQLLGISYNQNIYDLMYLVQLHRGLTNGFINGNNSFKNRILDVEKNIKKNVLKLLDFDSDNLMLLRHDREFARALGRLELIMLKNLSINDSNKVFSIHSKIIDSLIKTFSNISNKTSFVNSKDMKINFIANLLKEKLFLIEENMGKIRGLSVGIFAQKSISDEIKHQLFPTYVLVKSLESNIEDNHVLTNMDNYIEITKLTTIATDKSSKMLDVVNKNIFMSESFDYDSKAFFNIATEAINSYSKLYRTFISTYRDLVKKVQYEMYVDVSLVFVGFLAIIFASLYLFGAFYKSIVKSLKKLQHASEMIASGKTDIILEADTKDEIGNAILAFNDMSHKLNENISFLDGYKMAIDETSIVSKTDKRGVITYVNKLFCEISGFEQRELMGMSHNVVRHPDMPKDAFKEMWKTIKSKQVWHGVVKNRKKDGGYYIVDATIIPVLDSSGEIIEYIGVRHDVTELEKSKEEIKKQKIDLLTSLPNRTQLLEDLVSSEKPILFYLNIDDFSKLNDFYGAKIGDQVLIHMSEILQSVSKKMNANIYKLHADGFLIVAQEGSIDKSNHKQVMKEIIQFIEQETIDCDSKSCVSLTISGGVVFYDSVKKRENLLSCANIARKRAQEENRKFLTYDNDMNKDSDYQKNIEWINKIKDAIKEDRLTVFFQPIIDNKTGAITKYESLVRMIDTDDKIISPFFFLDIAKKAKLYTKITKIVLDKSFKTFEKLPQYEFSVNITVEDILDSEISEYIYTKLRDCKHANRVILEITESEEIKDYSVVNSFIKKVKSYGAKIAIDDFGSGYANFEHILGLEADFIKIDGSLIKNIDKDSDSRIITEAIIAFSKKLGSKTVVEFVHNEAVYDVVKELNADYSQGFYLGEPKPKLVTVQELLDA